MSKKTINLINQTHLIITKKNIVSPTQFILITISGGQDSLCLFFILLHLKKQWKWHFGLLYCNHFWQIDSFYINPLIFKLGFLFFIPAYLSVPSQNIFSEQKSRTWRYRQFDRLTTFYKYDIIFTGHTSTDKIETVLLQLLRGTGTRGLSTLDWIRPISRYKSIASPCPLKILPKVSSSLDVLTQTNKLAPILKINNVSLPHNFFRIQFCNKFFLSSQINCLKNNLFDKTKQTELILYDKFEKFVVEVFAQSKNKVLLKKQNFLNNKQSGSQKVFLNLNFRLPPLSASLPTLVVSTDNLKIKEQVDKTSCEYKKNLGTKLFFIIKPKSLTSSPFLCRYRLGNEAEVKPRVSKVARLAFQPSFVNLFFQSQPSLDKTFYGKNIGRNTTALQRDLEKIAYRNINWIYDDFLFLTLEKTLIFTPFDKLRYLYLKQNRFSPIVPILLINLLQKKSTTFDRPFVRLTPFGINRRIIFKEHFGTRPVNAVVNKIQFFFSLTSSNRLKFSAKRKLKYLKCSSFAFNTVILNQKHSKVLIKYFKISCWAKFKKHFLELEVLELKHVLNLEVTPFLIKSYLGLTNYQQIAIGLIIYPSITFSFFCGTFCRQMTFTNLSLSQEETGPNNLAKTQKNVKWHKMLNSITRTKRKTISNCYNVSLKEKTKNFLHKKYLLVNKPTYKIKDHTMFSSLQNKYDISIQIGKDVQLVLPNQKKFGSYERSIKQSFVVRPLLFITRFDLKKVCAFWELPVYPDQTNEKLVYFRNRIRKQLLPLLRFFFNPQIDKLFLQFAEIATTEQLYLDELAVQLQDKFEIKKINTFELNLAVFHFMPIAIKRRVLKQFLNQYFTKQIKFFHIKILLDVLAKRKKSRSVLPLTKVKLDEELKYKNNLLIRENYKVEYQNFSKLFFQEYSSTRSMTEEEFLNKPEIPNLTTKIRSEFLQHFTFVKEGSDTKAKLKRNLVNFDKKLSVRNIFLDKNQFKTPQILFFAGVGACFITSRRFTLLCNFIIV